MIQANTNNRWARLSQSEKAELLGIYTKHGYNDLANIIADYNTYADGGPEKTYQDYLDEYNAARSAKTEALKEKKAIDDERIDYIRNYNNPRGYWYWTDEGKRLNLAYDSANEKLSEARKNFDAAEKVIGEKTLEKYAGTAFDPMYFWDYVGNTKEEAEKYYKNRAIRESMGAGEVADYFNSYVNSPGFERIKENQRQWWLNRHPYRKIYEFGSSHAMGPVEWMQEKIQKYPFSEKGVFDLSTYPDLSIYRSGNGHIAITVGDFEDKNWPYFFSLPHEMAHEINSGGFATPSYSAQAEALEQNANTEPGHDSRPSEKHSDKEALMFLLYKEGIYDSRGDKDCTPEDIARLRKKYPGLRPLQQMDDEKAAWMINHVADAGNQESLYDNHIGNLSAFGGPIRIKPENRFSEGGPEKQNWFTRMMMNSVLNDPNSGAVATSAGWIRDRNGNVYQTEEALQSEGATQLRQNLAEISTMPLIDMGVGLAEAIITGTKAYKAYKLAKEMNKILKSGEFDAAVQATKEAPVTTAANTTKAAKGATRSISGKEIEVQALRDRFNKWAEYYGYDTIPENLSVEEAEKIMKQTFDRHNTFFRGVHPPDTREDIQHLEEMFGPNYAELYEEQVYPYVATHGRPGDGAVFVSPASNAGIYGSTGRTAVVRRNYSLGENPKTWLKDADFDIRFGGTEDAIKAASENKTLTFPWSETGHGIVENELLAPDGLLNFVEYVPEGAPIDYFETAGSLNKYLGKQRTPYGILDEYVPKPKFASGGKIHIKPENRGKFTALKKRTGHSASWFKTHGTPAQKKMAVFALNARKWKHADGGPLAITSQYIRDPQVQPRIETVRLPDLNIKMPEANIETPISFDLAPELYNMVPLMYDIPTVTFPFISGKEQKMEQLDPVKDAARRIRAVENSKTNPNGGWNEKEKRWYPHKSVEGGADTIAYGIKLSNGTPEAELAKKQGYLTDDQAIHFTDSLAQVYYDKAKSVYDKKYGDGEWDKLSPESQSFLTDFSYNPGLGKFPKLMEGFHSGDIDMIRKNYMRYSNGKPLGRNKIMLGEIEKFGSEVPIFRKCGGKIKKYGGKIVQFADFSELF